MTEEQKEAMAVLVKVLLDTEVEDRVIAEHINELLMEFMRRN